jgi:hypothetical protein
MVLLDGFLRAFTILSFLPTLLWLDLMLRSMQEYLSWIGLKLLRVVVEKGLLLIVEGQSSAWQAEMLARKLSMDCKLLRVSLIFWRSCLHISKASVLASK